ncbi:fimbrial biogenesis usher protein [Dickeya lacustris]|uniref:Fimbrial biogenesis usher protein n=1 Tax=Dickeya lacustris TaxID=2259638 RepID=A0ABY8GC80_9GAMM|nr:fimbrial biogenesis usher protein [Dickeya lacustris]WFN57578.1 fimbrial biogenesis usher protein [Dickeya lacustris]
MALGLLLMLSLCRQAAHAELYFNPRFLADDPAAVADLSRFEKGQEAPAGTYRVDIYLNDGFVTTRDVTFHADEKSGRLVPCLTRNQLAAMGVNTLSVSGMAPLSPQACVPLAALIDAAGTRFDVGRQRLEISVPQAYMTRQARGYIPPEHWDNGITAGVLNYSLNGNRVKGRDGGTRDYLYLNVNSGLNIGAWRLRDNTNWRYNSGSSRDSRSSRWQHINTYLDRDIVPWRARMTVGDSYTQSSIFDGINFRGAQIATDDNMLPDSRKGFAPVIRGIAHGTAQVSVKQNGYEIYQTTVPPGPFTINDLYAAGSSGDLQVSVKEVSGKTRVFSVPYSSVPILQREWQTKYALTAGKYRSGNVTQKTPAFFQATVMQGLPRGWTAYGGTQLSERYRAMNLGVGKNMGQWGALSLDVTGSQARLPDDSEHQGQSLRFLYNKALTETGTNLQLAGYRYSTQGYFNLSDTTYQRMSGYRVVTQDGVMEVKPRFTDYWNLAYSRRGRVQLSVTQQLGAKSTLYLSASQQTYWGTPRSDQQWQTGVSSAIDDINWTLSYNLTKNAWQQGRDQMLALSVSVPFSHWQRSDSRSVWRHASASYNTSYDMQGRSTHLAGVNGTLLPDNNLSYSVQSGYTRGDKTQQGTNGYAAMNYRGGSGYANVGYSRNDGYSQLYYGVSGGVVAHENGITLSQPLGDTVVLLKAPGAANAKVENQTGVTTDWRGYAVLPYATDYRENRVALDTRTLAENVDIDDAVVNVVPTRGAVVRADFNARVGMKALMTLRVNGKPVPFGAMVMSDGHQAGSIVADNGQVYLTGLPPAGNVRAKWGDGPGEQCVASYRLPTKKTQPILSQLTVQCQ